MTAEKRKNDEPRRLSWWLIIAAFALGVIVTLLLTQQVGRVETSVTQAFEVQSVEAFETPLPPDILTVTAASPLNSVPELNQTATAIIIGATQTARPNR